MVSHSPRCNSCPNTVYTTLIGFLEDDILYPSIMFITFRSFLDTQGEHTSNKVRKTLQVGKGYILTRSGVLAALLLIPLWSKDHALIS